MMETIWIGSCLRASPPIIILPPHTVDRHPADTLSATMPRVHKSTTSHWFVIWSTYTWTTTTSTIPTMASITTSSHSKYSLLTATERTCSENFTHMESLCYGYGRRITSIRFFIVDKRSAREIVIYCKEIIIPTVVPFTTFSSSWFNTKTRSN